MVNVCLKVLGLLLGLVGCLDFCASSLLHLSQEPTGSGTGYLKVTQV